MDLETHICGILGLVCGVWLFRLTVYKTLRIIALASTTIIAFCYISNVLDIRIYEVSGSSMEPTLQDGQTTVAYKGTLDRGDIVQLLDPSGDGTKWVKRLIGVPGDRIAVWGNYVEVNGVPDPTSEKYKKSLLKPKVFVLYCNEYFVCGDNRSVSWDSRYVGKIKRELILTETLFSF
jgi:signal peptidase I